MIYDGLRGYVSGDLNQPVNTVLAITKGPMLNRNWFSGVDPKYGIINVGAGQFKLQGTNDTSLLMDSNDMNPIAQDILPTDGASWTDLATVTSAGTTTGSFSTSYAFIRLIITTTGIGTILKAWVVWN